MDWLSGKILCLKSPMRPYSVSRTSKSWRMMLLLSRPSVLGHLICSHILVCGKQEDICIHLLHKYHNLHATSDFIASSLCFLTSFSLLFSSFFRCITFLTLLFVLWRSAEFTSFSYRRNPGGWWQTQGNRETDLCGPRLPGSKRKARSQVTQEEPRARVQHADETAPCDLQSGKIHRYDDLWIYVIYPSDLTQVHNTLCDLTSLPPVTFPHCALNYRLQDHCPLPSGVYHSEINDTFSTLNFLGSDAWYFLKLEFPSQKEPLPFFPSPSTSTG